MAMGTPSRAQASPPFTPSPSNVVQRRSIELKVAQSLAALPSPSDFESWAEVASATVAEPGADTPHDHGSSGSDAGDDMLQYLGAGSDVSTDDEDGAEVFDVGTLAESGPADTNAPAGTGAPAAPVATAAASSATACPAPPVAPEPPPARLSALASAVPAVFPGSDPERMRKQISLMSSQLQRCEDAVAAAQTRVAQAQADRDRSERANVELKARNDAVWQTVALLRTQNAHLSGVETQPLEELRGELLHQANEDMGQLGQQLAEERQRVRQLQTELGDQQNSDVSELESLRAEVDRLVRSAAYGDTICARHKRLTATAEQELEEQRNQCASSRQELEDERSRRQRAETELKKASAHASKMEQALKESQAEVGRLSADARDTEARLERAQSSIADLESQLADLRAFSGRGRGGDLGAAADLADAIALRETAEAERDDLRQQVAALQASQATKPETAQHTAGTQTEKTAQTETGPGGGGLEDISAECAALELQSLREDMQELKQQLRQADEPAVEQKPEPEPEPEPELKPEPTLQQSAELLLPRGNQAPHPSPPVSSESPPRLLRRARAERAGFERLNDDLAERIDSTFTSPPRREVDNILSALVAARRSLDGGAMTSVLASARGARADREGEESTAHRSLLQGNDDRERLRASWQSTASLYGGISDTFAAERFAHERSSDGHNNRYA